MRKIYFVHDKNPSDERAAGRFVATAEYGRGAERASGILLKHESLPGANEVGGHDRGKHY